MLVAALHVGVLVGAGVLMGRLAVVVRGRASAVPGVDWFLLALYLGVGSAGAQVVHLLAADATLQPVAAALAAKLAVWSVLATAVFASARADRPLAVHPVGRPALLAVVIATFVPGWLAPYQGMLHTGWVATPGPLTHLSTVPTVGGLALGAAVALVVLAGLGTLVGRSRDVPWRRLGLAAVGLAALPAGAGLTALGVLAVDWPLATAVGLVVSTGSVYLGLVRSPADVTVPAGEESRDRSDAPVVPDGGRR
jgi:hypothetical protein